ncbi:MAG: DUF6259 domain-containing protein [Armatimonadota bacterium]
MLRFEIACLLLALTATTALADDFVLIRAHAPETPLERVPLLVQTDAGGLRQATGLDELPQGMLYADEPARNRPVPAQVNALPDGRVQIAALLPADPPGEREIRVWLRNPPGTPPEAPDGLSAARRGDVIRVENVAYSIVHDPAVNAGLLSTIELPGLSFQPTLNDRVYDKDGLGGFSLRHDPEPEMQLVSDGPLYAEVRVAARYLREGGEAPEASPRATYTVRYWAGLPIFQVEAHVRQDQSFAWEELHLLELHHEEPVFESFAINDPAQVQAFDDDAEGERGGEWGALLTDEGQTVGILGSVIVHDGLGGYGRYLHGPWQSWSDTSAELSRWVYAASDPGALQTLDALAAEGVSAGRAWLMTQGLAEAMDELRSTLVARGEAANPQVTWRLSLIESAAVAGAPQAQLLQAARTLAQAVDAGRAYQHVPELPGGRLLLAGDGQLGVGILLTDAGVELVSLYDMVTRREMLAGPCDIFRLTLSDREGEATEVGSSSGWGEWTAQASSVGDEGTIMATFASPLDLPAGDMRAEVTCDISGGASRWRIDVGNAGPWSIDRVAMPVLSAGPLGDGADDMLYVPHGFGRGFENPAAAGPRYRGYYPSGSCALPLLVVTDPLGGLYLAAHDARASTREMVTGGGADGGVAMSVEVPAPNASIAGNDFSTSGEVVIARVDGGWYPATQMYRTWLQENARWWPVGDADYGRDDRPAWLSDIAAWILDGGGPDDVVGQAKAFAEYMGLPVAVHWYNWHQIPFDNDYPHYFPTKEGIREGVAELQEAGVRIVPYINGRLWDTDTESFQETAHQYCTRNREGEPYIEVYGSGEELTPMCIHTQFWRDTLHEIVMRLMTDVGVDGVYMDQIAAARPRLCYDRDHGHPLAGGHWWVDGYWQLLGRLQEDIAGVSPEKMLTTESNAEAYARFFDTYLMCNSLGDGLVPIFPAVYGSKILGFGRYMSAEDWDAPQSLAQKQGQLFVWGTQLWWSRPDVIDHEFAGPWLRDLARLRFAVREFFNEGRMLAPPVLEGNDTTVTASWHRREMQATTPAVLSSAWTVADGRILVPMVNCSEEAQTVSLHLQAANWELAEDADFSVRRLGPESEEQLGTWRAGSEHEVSLEGLRAAALVLTPEG